MALLDTETQVSVLIGGFTGGLDHPECISWGCDGFAYAGGELGQVYRISVEQKEFEEFANTGGFVGGIAQDAKHRLYVCSGGVKRIEPGGTVSVYCDGTDEQSLSGANYPVFDRHGNLYVSHSGGWKEDNGCICRVAPGGKGEVWCRSLTQFPNGLAMDAECTYLYVAMSLNPPRVDRVEIKTDGSAGEVETLVHLPETVPDGLAFDTEGNLYISCYRPDRIYWLMPSGQLDVLAEDYEGTVIAAPTNIAFCGQNRDLFLSANLGRWHITHYDLGKTGMPLNYPDI